MPFAPCSAACAIFRTADGPIVHDAIIIGAGAAGLMCALVAGKRGFRCALVDHASQAGRKLRLAGGGRGNVTNRRVGPEWYVGEQPRFAEGALRRCPPSLVLDMLDAFGIPWEERDHGRIFCAAPADRLADALLEGALAHGADFLPGRTIGEAECGDGLFHVQTSLGLLRAPRLVIAAGGPACPAVGASDGGMRLARRFGHRIVPPRPALAPFILPENGSEDRPESWPLHGLAGVSLPARVSVAEADARFRPETDALLFTHTGLSGPAALQASCFWRAGNSLVIDFLPETPLMTLLADPANGKATLAGLIKRALPSRLATRLLEQAGLAEETLRRNVAEVNKKDRAVLANLVNRYRVIPLRTGGMARAEASAGGVDTRDIHPKRLESRLVPNLYLAGEVLDVTGLLGGYNLHWAWASGKAAAEAFRAC